MQVIGQSAHSGWLFADRTGKQAKQSNELSRLTVPWRIGVPISRQKTKVQTQSENLDVF